MSCNNKEYLCIQWDSCESIRSQKDIERKEQRRTIQVDRDREREIERKRERERDSESERMRNTTHTQSDRRTDRRMAPREGSQWARQRRGEGKRESERAVERRVVSREGRTECSSIPPVDRWQIYGSTRNADGGPRGKRTSYTYRRERTKRDRRISRKLFSLSFSPPFADSQVFADIISDRVLFLILDSTLFRYTITRSVSDEKRPRLVE